ncbi:MAG: cytochrome c3 family protein [Deltaproteobacteria bacterium]|nr:cytochrome c3 family protein [Deltaproteobacteria bacterium]MBW1748282.1 cytochrome c3 family protein [Deltaproteobacteria bacterium]MBW1969214.1 cytochrome c3 family protein [Deltaproteobacteria bacterium]MBW2156501.1 cytochrome c3 family protein [Deltaproteobacteria bacterium]MBW2197154.1 cytochrome c3 family protein [Deltaproteobacteria bacterium]
MYRIQVGILCLVMVFVFGLALNVAGQDESEPKAAVEDMCVPMGVVELKPDPSVEQKKSSVAFNHAKHLTYDCRRCHHKWEANTKIANCTTSACHDLLKAPKRPTKYLVYTEEGIKYYKYAYHQNCIGCHKEIKVQRKKLESVYLAAEKELPKTGPTSCNECHPKE